MRTLDAFDGMETVDARFFDHQFSPHRHDAYVVGVTFKGVQRFRYRGVDRTALPGDAFVLHPDEVHDGRAGTSEGYRYRAVCVPPAFIAEALGGALPFIDGAVCRSLALNKIICELIPGRADAHDDLAKLGTISALADVLAALANRPSRAPRRTDYAVLKPIKDKLEAAATTGISITDLESEHGIDRYTLARWFRRCYGVSPHRFVIHRRLDVAKRSIRGGASLAEAAITSGFADQSHMTRHFRGAFGVSPGEWRGFQD